MLTFLPTTVGYVSRIARNMPHSPGTGADIVKLAIKVSSLCKRFFYDAQNAQLVNLVHDELVIECDEGDIDHVSTIARSQMEIAFSSILPDVPPEVSVKL